jgi:hypothetical protein
MGRTKETTMSLFDSLKGMAMQELQAQGPGVVNQMLANTPLAGASGLIDQLMQSGLGPQVQAMADGRAIRRAAGPGSEPDFPAPAGARSATTGLSHRHKSVAAAALRPSLRHLA